MAHPLHQILQSVKRKDWQSASEQVHEVLQQKVADRLATERMSLAQKALREETVKEARTEPIKVKCQECGAKFKTRSYDPTCPKCHGADIDIAEAVIKEEDGPACPTCGTTTWRTATGRLWCLKCGKYDKPLTAAMVNKSVEKGKPSTVKESTDQFHVGMRVKPSYSVVEKARQRSMSGGVLGDAGKREYARLRAERGTITDIKKAGGVMVNSQTLTVKWDNGSTSQLLDYTVEPAGMNESLKEEEERYFTWAYVTNDGKYKAALYRTKNTMGSPYLLVITNKETGKEVGRRIFASQGAAATVWKNEIKKGDFSGVQMSEAKEEEHRCEMCGSKKDVKKVDDTYICKECDIEESVNEDFSDYKCDKCGKGFKATGKQNCPSCSSSNVTKGGKVNQSKAYESVNIHETKMPTSEVQRVFDETGDVGETELLCGISNLVVNNTGDVVSFVAEGYMGGYDDKCDKCDKTADWRGRDKSGKVVAAACKAHKDEVRTAILAKLSGKK